LNRRRRSRPSPGTFEREEPEALACEDGLEQFPDHDTLSSARARYFHDHGWVPTAGTSEPHLRERLGLHRDSRPVRPGDLLCFAACALPFLSILTLVAIVLAG
jgi:hypothetical protein